MPKSKGRTPKRERHLNEYETSVLVDTRHVQTDDPNAFDPLRYEVERFATWYYIRYAKVYLRKPEVEITDVLDTTAFKLTFRWFRWEM